MCSYVLSVHHKLPRSTNIEFKENPNAPTKCEKIQHCPNYINFSVPRTMKSLNSSSVSYSNDIFFYSIKFQMML